MRVWVLTRGRQGAKPVHGFGHHTALFDHAGEGLGDRIGKVLNRILQCGRELNGLGHVRPLALEA